MQLNRHAPRIAGAILLTAALAGIVYNFQIKPVFYDVAVGSTRFVVL